MSDKVTQPRKSRDLSLSRLLERAAATKRRWN